MAENEPIKPKPRPIIRIGLIIISHSLIFSVLCCAAGVVALFLLPVLAKNTYISENALMPGSASSMLTMDDVSRANDFLKDISGLNVKFTLTAQAIQHFIAEHMANLGGEVSYHKFHPQVNKLNPLNFFTSSNYEISEENNSCSSFGVNTVGIIRAPRGDGKEAIVIVTPYNSLGPTLGETFSLGIAYSIFSLLSRVTLLAKDIIWLAADSQHGEYASVDAWLRDYHRPVFGPIGKIDQICSQIDVHDMKTKLSTGVEISDGFKRAGTMAAALVIKVTHRSEEIDKDALSIYAEASNGQMPNLDLINIVNYLAVNGQGMCVKVDKQHFLLRCNWLHTLGYFFEKLGQVVKGIAPDLKFGMYATDYVESTATLARSLYNQALGVPTGSHGAFRDYQVDAITMEFSPRFSLNFKERQSDFLLRGGRLVEGVVRSVNNLLEKFHQSFFLYLLTSPNRFVSVGVYMIAFLLIVAPLPMIAASLYLDASTLESTSEEVKVASSPSSAKLTISFRSWKWVQAAKRVFVVHLWGAIVTLLPYFICQIPNCSSTASLIIWIVLSIFSLFILHLLFQSPIQSNSLNHPQEKEWALFKAVTVAAAFIGLCLMSVINFATAEIGALLIVPICLVVKPLMPDVKFGTPRAFARVACSLAVVFIGFPPASYFLLKAASDGVRNVNIGEFWNWIESLWAWNSASYIYICMVHLPCWALCILVLFHPC